MDLRRLALRSPIGALAIATLLGMSTSISSAAGPAVPSPIDKGGSAPTGAEQSATWTAAQMQVYANKLAAATALAGMIGAPAAALYVPAGLPPSNRALAPMTVTPANGNIPGVLNDAEPNSAYGYQCGPAAGHNALGGYGVNYPIGTGSYGGNPQATYLTYEMRTTVANGTYRTYMPGALNGHQSQNVYVWQNIGGTSDVIFYTTLDIQYLDAPIYNIETYGYDPIQKKYRYPFVQWNGWNIAHYVTAYAYQQSGNYISISDSAVAGSYTGHQRYTQYYVDIWVAINNNPNTNQILW